MDELYRLQVTIAAGPAAVYKALTSAGELQTWFAESAQVDLPARRYDFWGRYTPETPDREQGRHEIIAAEQDRLLRFTWPLDGVATEVEYRLHPREGAGNATILTVTHTGCDKDTSGPCAPEDFWLLTLENLRRHVEGRRVYARFDFHTLNNKGDVRHEIEIDAPADVVFAKLVEPAELNRWIAYNAAVDPQPGGTFDLGWGEGSDSQIVEIEPPTKLVYGWAGTHVVTWTLEGSGGKTRLLIVHSGFDPDAIPGERLGWLNFMTWIGSMSEVGPSWQSPLCLVNKDYPTFYSRSLNDRQSELLPGNAPV
ncbi:MAG TPA: SRPBCC domain-containing protein [Chloroflexia bacterium]|nr:SRPBCC domain-containing protein [Chloroflexia bacterium]